MEPEPIGYTRWGQCGGTGKNDGGTACSVCEGTGLMPVFRPSRPRKDVPAVYSTQRRFPRYYTDLPIRVREQERELGGRCAIIAENGIGVILPKPFPAGSVITVQLPVPTNPTAVEALGVVRNQSGLRHGIEFVSLTDSERGSIQQFCAGLTRSDM
ncbi:MAG TPA: PilZ domain-containing protein [Terriglobales bacterium]|nr:PilZ domain-containing protein [Terriglobales bacterium]